MTDYQVIIAGGGMVGLTIAAALGGAGIKTAVVDRVAAAAAATPDFDGRVSAIAGGSKTVLEGIGAWPALNAHAEPIREIRVSDDDSPLFIHYDGAEIGTEALGFIAENRWTRRALLDVIAGLDSVAIHDGRAIAALERNATEAVLHLDDGGMLSAALVIAADGRGSPLRHGAGIEATAWRYDQIGIVCTIGHDRPHRGVAQERFLPAGPFAILPMTKGPGGGNRSSIVWTEGTATGGRILELGPDAFQAELERRFTDYLGKLRVEGPVFSYPLTLTLAERYHLHRLALAGDAAHAIHPIAGQGFNLGIRDAAALAEVIVDAARLGLDPGATTVLDRYARWRRADNLAMLAVTDGLNRLFSNRLAPVALARRLGLAAVDKTPPLKRMFMRHAMGEAGDRPRLARGLAL